MNPRELSFFATALAEEERYHRQLDRLAARARGRRLSTLVHEGVRFATLLDERARFVPLLARAVADASFRPSVTRLGRAMLGGKERVIARPSAVDLLVHAVVAEVLAELIEPALSERLFSYRRGRSSWQALRAIARTVRTHRRDVPDTRARGLHVLRGDVRAYTDTIPLEDGAPIWRELAALPGIGVAHQAMLVALLRPTVDAGQGSARPRTRGLLFGLPTTNVLGNLYLGPLDRALESDGYARFGDDMTFADPSAERVREALSVFERILEERGLSVNEKKKRIYFWNGAPRASAAWPDATPVRDLPFLGAVVAFDGTIGLGPQKWRALVVDLHARIDRTAALVGSVSPRERAELLAAVTAEALDPRSELAHAYAPLVLDLVDDRRRLRQLDYLLALRVAERASGRRGVRAFREVSWRDLHDAGLPSTTARRDAR